MGKTEGLYMAVPRAHKFRLVSLFILITSFLLLTSTGFCQSPTVDIVADETVNGSVELTPGYISGDIYLGGQAITRIDMMAESIDFYAKIYPRVEGPYSMTVNAPGSAGIDYLVSGTVWMDNYTTRFYFKDRNTMVFAGETSQVDFIVEPGYVAVEIISNGCTLAKSEIEAYLEAGDAFSFADTKRGSENRFRFPVQPNANIEVSGYTQLASGQIVQLPSRFVTVTAGADTPVTWELNCGTTQLGAIQHDVSYYMPMDYHYSFLYNGDSYTPSRTVRHAGSHVFDNLAPGSWRLLTQSYWNGGHNFIAKQVRDIQVNGGEIVDGSIDEYPGFMKGRVILEGTRTMADTETAYMFAYGQNPLYPSYQSYSRALVGSADGMFNLALPEGEWSRYVSYFKFYGPDPADIYSFSYLYLYEYSLQKNTVSVMSNETVIAPDTIHETGTATIKYSRSDGGAFQSPFLYAKSYKRDELGRLNTYIYSYARGAVSGETVTFVGFPGTYEVDALAYVDGSQTTFGSVTIEIIGGVDKVVDIGGPALNVASPEPEMTFTEQRVRVTGTATDDMEVAAVYINGVEVLFTSTNNPDDPQEIFFSTEMDLVEGANEIKTIAIDASGNQSSDVRTVTYELPVEPVVEEPVREEPVVEEPVADDTVADEPVVEEPVSDDTVVEEFVASALIDIKPGSCKNPLNVKSKGVLPVVILGSEDFDVTQIDFSSLSLDGVSALRSAVEDTAATPEDSLADAGDECDTERADGYDDLAVKFDTQEIVEMLGEVYDGDVIELTLTGSLLDGTEFAGMDSVTMLVKPKSGKK